MNRRGGHAPVVCKRTLVSMPHAMRRLRMPASIARVPAWQGRPERAASRPAWGAMQPRDDLHYVRARPCQRQRWRWRPGQLRRRGRQHRVLPPRQPRLLGHPRGLSLHVRELHVVVVCVLHRPHVRPRLPYAALQVRRCGRLRGGPRVSAQSATQCRSFSVWGEAAAVSSRQTPRAVVPVSPLVCWRG